MQPTTIHTIFMSAQPFFSNTLDMAIPRLIC